jgi:hypothetical protein
MKERRTERKMKGGRTEGRKMKERRKEDEGRKEGR